MIWGWKEINRVYVILKALDSNGELTTNKLYSITKIPKSTLCEYLQMLKEAGMIERYEKTDVPYIFRRPIANKITEKGKKLLRIMEEFIPLWKEVVRHSPYSWVFAPKT